MAPLRALAMAQTAVLNSPFNPASHTQLSRSAVAAGEVFESITRRYRKPEWKLPTTRVASIDVDVTPVSVWDSPWASLIHFQRDQDALIRARGKRADPKVMIVAPLSGHYATLLRGTVEAFLPEHEVYITDWADARMVPLIAGQFDLNDYIDHVIAMIREVKPDHIVAVCQPGPPVLAAIAIMEEDGEPHVPVSMTFMGSPIDARRSPTQPNVLAMEKPFEWFEQQMVHTVPPIYPGGFRRVYPGFVQLASFMGMNLSRHVDAHKGFFKDLVKGDGDSVQKHREFYEEYLSVLDLSGEFYLQTIRDVFQEHKLPRGVFEHRGRLVKPASIKRVALMTVEGEKDDISGIGQTQAAHDICTSIPEAMRLDYVQPGVGHYGVFNGRRFSSEIMPRMREFQRAMAHRRYGKRPALEVVQA